MCDKDPTAAVTAKTLFGILDISTEWKYLNGHRNSKQTHTQYLNGGKE